jgi:hypothetical protein
VVRDTPERHPPALAAASTSARPGLIVAMRILVTTLGLLSE